MNTGFAAVLSRINCQRWDIILYQKNFFNEYKFPCTTKPQAITPGALPKNEMKKLSILRYELVKNTKT